jgi:protein-disulfide isomerase
MTREAGDVGARSTPTLMINGRLLAGVQGIEQVRQAIAEAGAASGK